MSASFHHLQTSCQITSISDAFDLERLKLTLPTQNAEQIDICQLKPGVYIYNVNLSLPRSNALEIEVIWQDVCNLN